MVFVRKSPGRSGAVYVQIAERKDGRDVVLEHVGTARGEAAVAALVAVARDKIHEGQGQLDLVLDSGVDVVRPATISSKRSVLLWQVLTHAYQHLGFDCLDDEAFRQLVLARLIEPTSKADSVRVLTEVGVAVSSRRSFFRALQRANERDYRSQLAAACFAHCLADGDLSLILYDVTTLYFETEKEDDLRKVGFSKERRVDPQIVLGLLVDREGFPLEVGCFEGNKAETATLMPMISQFQDRHNIADMVIVADAGMLSASNLKALDEANLRFIVGSRVTKAPKDLESHFRWHGDAFEDGHIIDTITPKRGSRGENNPLKLAEPIWDPQAYPHSWRAVWAYSAKRAARDTKTLTKQENRAKAVVAGEAASRRPRFVKKNAGGFSLDQAALDRARRLVGLKGYVTNIEAGIMPPLEVISSYHDLWQVEASFRMSKNDLRARPVEAVKLFV